MVHKDNYITYKESDIHLVGLIMSREVVYVPDWGVFRIELFGEPASQEEAEKCQSEIDARNEYYNHEVGSIVPNNFDIGKWRKYKKKS